MRVVIAGAGNLLLSDEGFGVHFVRYLEQHYLLPASVELLDAGTLGLMIAHRLEDADRVYLVDTLETQGEPGASRRYAKEEFLFTRMPLKLSPHQAGLQEMLLLCELRGRCPNDIFLLGIIPASLAPGVELTPVLQRRLTEMAEELVAELRSLGFAIQQRRD